MGGAKIHPTAIIGKNVKLEEDVEIGPFTVLDGEINIGRETIIMPYVYITGYTEIGRGNKIHPGVVIGDLPQDLAFEGKKSFVKIGERNIFREFTTVHRGTKPGSATVIGDDNYFMINSHVAHNCQIGNQVKLCNGVLLGGWIFVGDRVFIGGNAAAHQFVRIGKNAMIGGLTAVKKDVPPYLICEGDSTIRGINTVGLKRSGYTPEQRLQIKAIFKKLYMSSLNVSQFCEQIVKEDQSEITQDFLEFIRGSERGLCRYLPHSKERKE